MKRSLATSDLHVLELIRRMRRAKQSTTSRNIFAKLYVADEPSPAKDAKTAEMNEEREERTAQLRREFKRGMRFLKEKGLLKQPIDEYVLTRKANELLQRVFESVSSSPQCVPE